MKLRIAGLTLLALLCSCKHPPQSENDVPIVGLNREGHTEVTSLPVETFHAQFSPFIQKMSDEVSFTLDEFEFQEQMPWTLSRVTVGLALETEVDLFEIVEGELEGEIELRFQKTH